MSTYSDFEQRQLDAESGEELDRHAARFANVSCSHCGGDFGPGNHGYSHCEDHAPKRDVFDMLTGLRIELGAIRCAIAEGRNDEAVRALGLTIKSLETLQREMGAE